MGIWVNRIYAAVLAWLALEAWFLPFVPENFLPLIVAAMGVLVLFTPMGNPTHGEPLYNVGNIRPRFQWLRRWVFGAFIVISGLVPLIQNYTGSFIGGNYDWLYYASIERFSGQVILLGISAIYFLGTFARTRGHQISSI